jgi:hypothetical protein
MQMKLMMSGDRPATMNCELLVFDTSTGCALVTSVAVQTYEVPDVNSAEPDRKTVSVLATRLT